MRRIILLLLLLTPCLALDLTISETGSVTINEITTQEFTSKTGSDWLFVYENETLTQELKIHLPKKTTLKSIDTTHDYSITYENTLIIKIHPNHHSLKISVQYYFEETKNNNYILLLFLIPITILVTYLFLKNKKTNKKFLRVLNKRERQVLLTIKKEKGNIKQSNLKKITGLPKSTLSRTINSLEKKGLITKQGHGMTNRVIIK
ncbi:MAG: MarR family transcriptional regulator [Nanoarchaeota archaeon]|nr:MarR family transcriptional regulator [Nanoarchaeota archaeon]